MANTDESEVLLAKGAPEGRARLSLFRGHGARSLSCTVVFAGLACAAAWLFALDPSVSAEGAPRALQRRAELYLLAMFAWYAAFPPRAAQAKVEFLANREMIPIDEFRSPRGAPGFERAYESAPSGVSRSDTFYGACDCGRPVESVVFWPADDDARSSSVTVNMSEVRWVRWPKPVSEIKWFCTYMSYSQRMIVNLEANQWVSFQVSPRSCGDEHAGLVQANKWTQVDYISSIPFVSGTEGYACFKIPALLRTLNGTFIAISEARNPDCSDFAATDLVYKRSTDGGMTWGPLQLLVQVTREERENGGICGHKLVIGNVAPVQLRLDSSHHPGRILAPYTRNNFKAWVVWSDDDGVTWHGDVEIPNATVIEQGSEYEKARPDCERGMSYFAYAIDRVSWSAARDLIRFASDLCFQLAEPYKDPAWTAKLSGAWQFVGLGPPGSLQLRGTGRVIVPAYHSYIRGLEGNGHLPVSQLYNNFAVGHVLISDDGGDTWHRGDTWPVGEGADESQLVELRNGTLLANSRSLSTGSPQVRMQAWSNDGGEHFSESAPTEIPQPFNGCQGSVVSGVDDIVYVSGPDPAPPSSWLQTVVNMFGCGVILSGRERMTLWKSADGGRSYPMKTLVDPGLSAQTSMQFHGGKLYMLYEQADPAPSMTMQDKLLAHALENLRVLLPSRFVFRELAV